MGELIASNLPSRHILPRLYIPDQRVIPNQFPSFHKYETSSIYIARYTCQSNFVLVIPSNIYGELISILFLEEKRRRRKKKGERERERGGGQHGRGHKISLPDRKRGRLMNRGDRLTWTHRSLETTSTMLISIVHCSPLIPRTVMRRFINNKEHERHINDDVL